MRPGPAPRSGGLLYLFTGAPEMWTMRRIALLLAIALPILALSSGCQEELVEEFGEPVVRLTPRAGGVGMSVDLEFRGTNTDWDENTPTVDMGEGITVRDVEVDGRTLAFGIADIAPDAPLGWRDVLVSFGERQFKITDGFVVQTGAISILPDRARLGESLDIEVTGVNTSFQDGYTQASFGEGIWIDDVEVLSEAAAIVRISIDPTASPGARNVTLFNGSTAWTLYEGFLVDRSAVTIAFDPPQGSQGETVDFTIVGTNSSFDDGETVLEMGDDIVVDYFDVIDATNAFGTMTISNAADLGLRDVSVISGDEILIVHDGFEVLGSPPDVDNTLCSISVSVTRAVDNNSCAVEASYSASIVFYAPLDPPCGESPPPTMVFPFDINYNYPIWQGDDTDCPFPATFDAGEYVYLDSSDGTHAMTFERYVDPYSGITAYYLDHTMTLDDYHFDRHYSLRADGSDDLDQIQAFDTRYDETPGSDPGGVIMHTIPLDYDLLQPQLCNNFTHDPNDELLVEWTMAMTYDVAGLAIVLQTQDAEDPDNGAYNIVLPWDDGEWIWEPEQLLALPEGNGYLVFSDGASQPTWQLPFSDLFPSGPMASSGITTMGFLILNSSAEEPEE